MSSPITRNISRDSISWPSTPTSNVSDGSESVSLDLKDINSAFDVLGKDNGTFQGLLGKDIKSLDSYIGNVERLWDHFVEEAKLPAALKGQSESMALELFDESGLGSLLFRRYVSNKTN